MAITVQYVVTHKGEEKLVTVDKKEANDYDKMLSVADNLNEFLVQKGITLDEQVAEDLTIALAKDKDAVAMILRGKPLESLKS